ncbi:MAG: helix-turn-helix transcriptional regulator [Faecalibacterium sp.]
MIRAYDKLYLDCARTVLARMFDFAVYDLKIPLDDFFDLFLQSGIAVAFARGDSRCLAGTSGVELAYQVLEKTRPDAIHVTPNYAQNRSPEYWAGWSLAYYQWYTGLSFAEIKSFITLHEIVQMYSPYHEMDVQHFVDALNARYRLMYPDIKLKALRERVGITQQQLADFSEVPKRTIQQYEQRQKQINKAQGETLFRLAQVLCCKVEDLLERVA